MAKKRKTLQIDVKGPSEFDDNIMQCLLYVDGRACKFFMSKANYKALIYDGIFVRDGNSTDSAGVINTTNLFEEVTNG